MYRYSVTVNGVQYNGSVNFKAAGGASQTVTATLPIQAGGGGAASPAPLLSPSPAPKASSPSPSPRTSPSPLPSSPSPFLPLFPQPSPSPSPTVTVVLFSGFELGPSSQGFYAGNRNGVAAVDWYSTAAARSGTYGLAVTVTALPQYFSDVQLQVRGKAATDGGTAATWVVWVLYMGLGVQG